MRVRLILAWSTLKALAVPPFEYNALTEAGNDRHVIDAERSFLAGSILPFVRMGSATDIIGDVAMSVADTCMPGNLMWASCACEIVFGKGNRRLTKDQSEHDPGRNDLTSEGVISHLDGSPISGKSQTFTRVSDGIGEVRFVRKH